uniref:Uncharacterized protein n=1 Tax=Triticum urartu TaxID=4572 RepID=A0A8R7PQ24_TRIUA
RRPTPPHPTFLDRAAYLPGSRCHHRLLLRIHSPTILTVPNHEPCSSLDPFLLDATSEAITVPPGLLNHGMRASRKVPRASNPRRRLPPFASSPLPRQGSIATAHPHPRLGSTTVVPRPFNDATPTASS